MLFYSVNSHCSKVHVILRDCRSQTTQESCTYCTPLGAWVCIICRPDPGERFLRKLGSYEVKRKSNDSISNKFFSDVNLGFLCQ